MAYSTKYVTRVGKGKEREEERSAEHRSIKMDPDEGSLLESFAALASNFLPVLAHRRNREDEHTGH
jgi:hypothetical protein